VNLLKKSFLVVAGPTGSGKSALALALAQELGGEIIGCDSVQLYRGFDIGSAKPTLAERSIVRHHLIDCLTWQMDYDAAQYARDALVKLAEVRQRGQLPIVVGGTGLYLRALLGQGWHADLPQDEGLRARLAAAPLDDSYEQLRRLDPQRAAQIHPHDGYRVRRSLELVTLLGRPLHEAGLKPPKAPQDHAAFVMVLAPERTTLHAAIAARTQAMLSGGLVDEVRGLLAQGVAPTAKPMQSIGYKQALAHLGGELDDRELPGAIMAATRQYAKRQSTWFRGVVADERLVGGGSVQGVAAGLRAVFG